MQTIFYTGRAYPHKSVLQEIKTKGYKLGLFHDTRQTIKNQDIFDYVVELDFSTEKLFTESLRRAKLPKIDGLMCVGENYIVYKALAAKFLSVPSISIDSARACTDKSIMRQKFHAYDPAITPEFVSVESKEQLLDFARRVGFPLILKPTNLIKSLLVTKCTNEIELIQAYEATLDQIHEVYTKLHITNRTPGIILERFVVGKMCSVAAFIDADGTPHFCEGIVDLITAQDVGYDDNFLYARKLPSTIHSKLQKKILSVAYDGIKALSMTSSAAHIEIIYNNTEVKLVEIGARIGGYRPFMYEKSYGINMLHQEIKTAVGDVIDLSGKFRSYSAMYELFPRNNRRFVKLSPDPPVNEFDYFHLVAKPGAAIGKARDAYKASAIIGISDQNYNSFTKKCADIAAIEVITT